MDDSCYIMGYEHTYEESHFIQKNSDYCSYVNLNLECV